MIWRTSLTKDLWVWDHELQEENQDLLGLVRVYEADEVDKEVEILRDMALQNEEKLRNHMTVLLDEITHLRAKIADMKTLLEGKKVLPVEGASSREANEREEA
jgi:hypothetical protein